MFIPSIAKVCTLSSGGNALVPTSCADAALAGLGSAEKSEGMSIQYQSDANVDVNRKCLG